MRTLMSVKILIDHGERRSGLPEQLTLLGLAVEVVHLAVGDVVVGGDAAAVERKSVADLHRSIATGRLWRQIGALRASYDVRYLIVEGSSLWRGPIRRYGIRGALLAVAASGVTVLRADDVSESAGWIQSIAVRAQRSERAPRRRQVRVRSPYSLLRTIPGMTPDAASGLLARFGSIRAVAEASDTELLDVMGVGPAKVAALRRAFD
jgi:DNA excision repair protein ERCC-4